MKLRGARVGMYVSIGDGQDATVWIVEEIDGRILKVKEVINGKPHPKAKSQFQDVSLFEPATEVQLVNAGVKAMPEKRSVESTRKRR